MKIHFEHEEGKIFLVTTTHLLDQEPIVKKIEVTNDVMPVVDDYLDYHIFKEFNKGEKS